MWAAQDYRTLRTLCLEKGQLFDDPAFPRNVPDPNVEWKRPPDLFSNPKFIESGFSSTDVCQGDLGRLVYTKSDSQAELWSALLEKAYAKVCGGYSALQGGTIAETLEDFTGGIAENVSLSRYPSEEVWEMVTEAESRKALMACYIQVLDPADVGRVDEEGLVLGHAYSVLGAKEVKLSSGEVTLIRLRNPWGFTEYNGPWSDKSQEWSSVSDVERKALNLQKEDGEFWMLCEDFCSLFSWIVICEHQHSSQYKITEVSGRWERGINAGGGRRLKSFFTNPQFRFRLGVTSDQEEESVSEPGNEERWMVLAELLQTDRRAAKLHLTCHLYRVPEELVPRPHLDRGFFTRSRPVADTGTAQNSRGVTMRASLTPGEYVIVPATYDANQEGNFYIRVHREKEPGNRT